MMKVRSPRGLPYFLIFINNLSKKLWVYPMKTKDQAIENFMVFHALVESEIGIKLNCIQTDNEGECIGLFDNYHKEYGITVSRQFLKPLKIRGWQKDEPYTN